jgi:hypothetical protein
MEPDFASDSIFDGMLIIPASRTHGVYYNGVLSHVIDDEGIIVHRSSLPAEDEGIEG